MRSPETATSARSRGAPVPSITMPPLKRTSYCCSAVAIIASRFRSRLPVVGLACTRLPCNRRLSRAYVSTATRATFWAASRMASIIESDAMRLAPTRPQPIPCVVVCSTLFNREPFRRPPRQGVRGYPATLRSRQERHNRVAARQAGRRDFLFGSPSRAERPTTPLREDGPVTTKNKFSSDPEHVLTLDRVLDAPVEKL